MWKFIFISMVFSLAFVPMTFAQEKVSSESGKSDAVIEYELAYPGIPPTSPFYPIKMLRDRVIGYLIADPLKKTEFSLLQADKRLQGGVLLLMNNKNMSELAISTISKGENYFAEAFQHLDVAKKQKKDIQGVSMKLYIAARKHREVLKSIERSVPAISRGSYLREYKRVEGFIKKAEVLIAN